MSGVDVECAVSRWGLAALCALLLATVACPLPAGAWAEQASDPSSPAAGMLDAGGAAFSCAITTDGQVRCWGYGGEGELGYPGVTSVGASDTPAALAPVDIGAGYTATAISSGDYHTCAIRDDGSVLCWGYGADGRLGYGNTNNVGDTMPPAAAGPVDLGAGRTATAISAGDGFTCAILDDGSVRCWGYGEEGQLGYGNENNVGDGGTDQTVASVGPVDFGAGAPAVAVTAGGMHACAILSDGSVHCWGYGFDGQLGYGSTDDVGDGRLDPNGNLDLTVAQAGPVDLGGHKALAIAAGALDTCAILDDRSVRCWGDGADGQLANGATTNLGQTPTTLPASTAPVDLGPGHSAQAITAGDNDACVILDDGGVRCWGYGGYGELGYGNQNNLGDTPTDLPGMVGPVNLGPGRTAAAISAGEAHTCARLNAGSVLCWGDGAYGQLGYCNTHNVGDTPTDTPNTAGPVNLEPGDGGQTCPPAALIPPPPGSVPSPPSSPSPPAAARAPTTPNPDLAREHGWRACLATVTAAARHLRARIRHGSKRQRVTARRRLTRRLVRGKAHCIKQWGRTPGPVTGLTATTRGPTKIQLNFNAPGTNKDNPPAAHTYLIKQSTHPIRNQHEFTTDPALCHGACRFTVSQIGAHIALTITHLHPPTTYYYAIAALDNVTARPGPRTRTVKARTA